MSVIFQGKKIVSGFYNNKNLKEIWIEGNKIWPKFIPEEMVLVIKTTSANTTIDLTPWVSIAPSAGISKISIDWGDVSTFSISSKNYNEYTLEEREIEKIEIVHNDNEIMPIADIEYDIEVGEISHTYSKAGTYRISLKGIFKWGNPSGSIWDTLTPFRQSLISVEIPTGSSPLRDSGYGAFYLCVNLESIPAGIFDNCVESSHFSHCFYDCYSLQSIPEGLFDKCTEATNFQYCFNRCSALQSIPKGLFDKNTKADSFWGSFGYCTSLKSIPEGLFDNNELVTNFNQLFTNCSNLQSIPDGLFDKCPNVTGFSSCFSSCSQLQSIPERLFDNCTKVKYFEYCFSSCSRLQSIPKGLFDNCTLVTDFSNCFSSCSQQLQSIPEGLFDSCTEVTAFARCFQYCRVLKSIPEHLFDNCTKVTNFDQCFSDCSSVTGKLPTLWISHPTASHRYTFELCYGASNYTAAQQAGWT